MTAPTTIHWFRRDLRLSDNPGLYAAAARGSVAPVFILDPQTETALGAAAKLRLEASLASLSKDLKAAGATLVLRRGPALAMLADLVAETGATRVHWTRLTDGASISGGASLAPRTGIGLSQNKRFAYFMVVDGRRSFVDGATTQEVGDWLKFFGAYDGINMDGGGSTTMARFDQNDGAVLLNSPVG
ncbi:MAG: deoxyribodipyrimidine photo-lyase, partial [Pseudomonadota bacterium]